MANLSAATPDLGVAFGVVEITALTEVFGVALLIAPRALRARSPSGSRERVGDEPSAESHPCGFDEQRNG